MGNKKPREAVKNVGLFFTPGGQGGTGIVTPMNATTLGTGEPGPDDDWHFPEEPADATVSTGATTEPGPPTKPGRVG